MQEIGFLVSITPLKTTEVKDIIIMHVTSDAKTVRHVIILQYSTVSVHFTDVKQFDYEQLKLGEIIGQGSFSGELHFLGDSNEFSGRVLKHSPRKLI